MILLDTNVISETMRHAPDSRVVEWMDAQPLETFYLSVVTVAELRAGVELLPAGKRRTALHEDVEERTLPLFIGRVLAFDTNCTSAYAKLLPKARAAGRKIDAADAYIAATALTYGFAVATRDTAPFAAAGVKVIDPWKAIPGMSGRV
jgi:predicted nucleic acid-binding protein